MESSFINKWAEPRFIHIIIRLFYEQIKVTGSTFKVFQQMMIQTRPINHRSSQRFLYLVYIFFSIQVFPRQQHTLGWCHVDTLLPLTEIQPWGSLPHLPPPSSLRPSKLLPRETLMANMKLDSLRSGREITASAGQPDSIIRRQTASRFWQAAAGRASDRATEQAALKEGRL